MVSYTCCHEVQVSHQRVRILASSVALVTDGQVSNPLQPAISFAFSISSTIGEDPRLIATPGISSCRPAVAKATDSWFHEYEDGGSEKQQCIHYTVSLRVIMSRGQHSTQSILHQVNIIIRSVINGFPVTLRHPKFLDLTNIVRICNSTFSQSLFLRTLLSSMRRCSSRKYCSLNKERRATHRYVHRYRVQLMDLFSLHTPFFIRHNEGHTRHAIDRLEAGHQQLYSVHSMENR